MTHDTNIQSDSECLECERLEKQIEKIENELGACKHEIDNHDKSVEWMLGRTKNLESIVFSQADEISQVLGKALHYPWYKDDQKNFPGATEKEGVCIGEHVAESIAAEAATRIKNLEAKLAKYEALTHQLNTAWMGGWDTVEQVHEAREAVANLVRQLEKE